MSNVDTGVSITKTENGWIAECKDGSTITKADIDALLEDGCYLEAMVKILQVLGFDVDEANAVYYSKNGGERPEESDLRHFDGHIKLSVDEEEVTVYVDVRSSLFSFESSGHTFPMRADGPVEVFMVISSDIDTNRLFHVLGHEMIHVRQIVSGMYKIWQWIYGPLGAEAYADIEASKWNISFCSLVPLPSDCHREFNNYLNVAAREFENRPLDGR